MSKEPHSKSSYKLNVSGGMETYPYANTAIAVTDFLFPICERSRRFHGNRNSTAVTTSIIRLGILNLGGRHGASKLRRDILRIFGFAVDFVNLEIEEIETRILEHICLYRNISTEFQAQPFRLIQ